LIASTSGPFGKVPLPPIGVLFNSFNSDKSIVDLSTAVATNEKTVSPGAADTVFEVNV